MTENMYTVYRLTHKESGQYYVGYTTSEIRDYVGKMLKSSNSRFLSTFPNPLKELLEANRSPKDWLVKVLAKTTDRSQASVLKKERISEARSLSDGLLINSARRGGNDISSLIEVIDET